MAGQIPEERMKILQMVENGRINAGEGAALLGALNQDDWQETGSALKSSETHRWFRVRVTDMFTGSKKVTVNIPFNLMEWGLKVGAQFSPEVGNIRLDELRELLKQDVDGKLVEVIDEVDGEHIEIFVD